MKYCEKCKCVTKENTCPYCKEKNLRKVFDDDFCFLTEEDEMWAKSFLEILKNNKIQYVTEPSLGFGLTMSTGLSERENIFVKYEDLGNALQLLENFK